MAGIFTRDSAPLGLVASARTARADAEDYLRRLAEETTDLVIAVEKEDYFRVIGGPAEVILRNSKNRADMIRLLDLVRFDDRPRMAEYLALCREQPKVRRRVEFQLAAEPQSWIELELMNSRREDPHVVAALIFRASDITENKRSQEALLERSDMLRTLTEASPLAIVITDRQGNVQMWNPAAERLFGWAGAETLGRPLPFPLDATTTDHRYLHERVLQGEAFAALEAQRRKRDGGIINVSIWTAPLREASGRISGTMEIIGDISERKQLETQLRQFQKMEGIGQLAGGVAHDFNNLLTAILGYADMLSRELPGSPSAHGERTVPEWQLIQEGIKEIRRAAERASTLTRSLLAFSRSQVLQPTIVDINAVISGMEPLLRRLTGESIDLATFLDPALSRVKADISQLEQVIMNLVVNAKDAMPKGGKLTIETGNVELGDTYAKTHVAVIPGTYVRLAVSDNGCGMDTETKLRVFEPFFTTKERGKGTGLGLSTVYGIVKQSDGYVWVYSEPGHGTTFKVYLPTEQALPSPKHYTASAEPAPRGREIILLVEDEEIVRALVRQVLTWHGYHVLEAPTAEEALRILDRGEPVDLLLTDVIMPGMNAIELVKRVEVTRPALRVIYMSGYTDHAIVRNGLLEGDVAFLQKPFAPNQLAHKVREVLSGPT